MSDRCEVLQCPECGGVGVALLGEVLHCGGHDSYYVEMVPVCWPLEVVMRDE